MTKPYHLALLKPNDEDRLLKAIRSLKNADTECLLAQHAGGQPRLSKAETRYDIAKHRLFKLAEKINGSDKRTGD